MTAPPVAATFLFTDLVGSTRLSTSVAPAQADAIRQQHFALLRRAIAATGGTEVKNLGDGLMVVFPSASAGLNGAVAIQQAVATANRAVDPPLAVRIGVATGEATEEDGDYFGDPVVEAARLCAEAGGGDILATALVRATAGRRSSHQLEHVGERDLKGLPAPVEVWAVVWSLPEDDATAHVPLPAKTAAEPPLPFIGRPGERDELRVAWKDAAAGGRRVVLLAGEPGIGKSRLAREVAVSAYAEGATVLFGGCDDGLAAPYRPWIEAVGHLVRHAPDAVIDSVGPRRLGELSRVVPAVHDRAPGLAAPTGSDAETERYLFYSAVVDLLAEAASFAPLVVVLDDLHWADRPSLALLRHVVASPECRRLLIVATYRDAEVGADHPLADTVAALRREPIVDRIALSGLAQAEVVALVDAAAGGELGEAGADFADALRRETDGNPFFAWEVMRHLAETGFVSRDGAGRWSQAGGELHLPDSVREVVERRVHHLGPEAHAALTAAAVGGAEFDLSTLSATLGRDADRVLDDMDAAERAGLVRSTAPEQYRFAHALVRHTLYEELSPTRRSRLHRQWAEALESTADPARRATDLARHWAAAVSPGDVGKAISYARLAGDQAMASLAPDQAVMQYSHALELAAQHAPGDERLHCALLCSLAEALCQAGDPSFRGYADEAVVMAERLADTPLLVRAAGIDYRHAASGYDEDRCRAIRAALRALGEADTPDRVHLLVQLSGQMLFVDGPEARRLGRESIAVARRLGDRRVLMHALSNYGRFLWELDRLRFGEEALEIAESLGDPTGTALAGQSLFMDTVMRGSRRRAEEVMAVYTKASREARRPDLEWITAYYAADWELLLGNLAEADRLTEAAWELGRRTGQPGAVVVYASERYNVCWHAGRPEDAADAIAAAAAEDANLSLLHLAGGAGSEQRNLREVVAGLQIDGAWLGAIGMLVPAVARSGDLPLIADVYGQMLPYRQILNKQGPFCLGPVAHQLAALSIAAGRYDDAEAHFIEADALNRRVQFPFYTVRTNVEWARSLLDGADRVAGARARARSLLSEALETSQRHGYGGIERRVTSLLARAT